ncbi:META domain-containing protein [Fluviibacterium sp. S390]|uniref:META domain-containing protein n=1 Tax=Fluviibacterium sp. S390 TaxID=3415139 RepID=UPI003C7EB3B7
MFMSRAALALALATAASGAFAQSPVNPLEPAQHWRLTTLNGERFPALARFSLAIDRRIAGRAPCNSFLATLDGTADSFTIGPIVSTRAACENMAEETEFLRVFGATTSARLDGENLVMTGPDGSELVFVKTDPPET